LPYRSISWPLCLFNSAANHRVACPLDDPQGRVQQRHSLPICPAFGIVFMCTRIAEIDQDSIAYVSNETFEALHEFGNSMMIGADQR
jgi:hypothetical protein